MASDREERKHRRSSDDESEEPSKRRKHRHHRRHHHRRHSRKHDKHEDKREEEKGEEENPEVGPPSAVVSYGNSRPDYDMEEGEIVEEEGADIEEKEKKKKADSDVESGEIKTESDGALALLDRNSRFSLVDDNENVGGSLKDNGREIDELMTNAPLERDIIDSYKIQKGVDLRMSVNKEHNDTGDARNESCVRDTKQGTQDCFPEKTSRKNDDYDARVRKEKSLFNEKDGEVHKCLESSPLRERSRKDVNTKSRSRSRESGRGRERSRSESISHGAPRLETCKEDTEYYTSTKNKVEIDDERRGKHTKDYRHGSRDSSRDKERERSSSRGRHNRHADKHRGMETRGRVREGSLETRDRERGNYLKEVERERMKRKERESSRDTEWYREREIERERKRRRDRRDMRERDTWEMERREREGREQERDRGNVSDRNTRNYKYHDSIDGNGGRDRSNDYKLHKLDEKDYRDRSRKNDTEKADDLKNEQPDVDREKLKSREEVDQDSYVERNALEVEEEEDEDVNRIKEESRRRIQAILEKRRAQKSQQQEELVSGDAVKKNLEEPPPSVASAKVVSNTRDGQREGSNTDTGDMSFSVGKSPPQNGVSAIEKNPHTEGLGEGTPKSERSNGDDIFGESSPRVHKSNERSNDMFSDDIFGESPAGMRKSGKGDGVVIQRSGLQDNWDDAEGYYSYRFGEILDGRYEVVAAHGKGVFSTVVRAKDLKARSGDPEEVAIKIIRNNEKMYKAGLDELVILKKLVGADVDDRRHCVRFLSSFKYRNHLCLVFESLHMNLREVLKKFGRNIGLKLTAVRAYAKQLFIALKHLRNCGVLHTDIKPDNMLVNDAKNVLKLCDFGNAMLTGKNEITPYLVSRFYRAPEIILGLPYDHPVDIWSVGCCLFELYSGKVLFPGPTNNDMLRLHMELKGPFPKKMLRKGAFTERHFDPDLNFCTTEEDPVTKKALKRLVTVKPKDIGSILVGSPGDDPKMLANFKDLLDKIFILDPDKRITVQQALSHPFITGK